MEITGISRRRFALLTGAPVAAQMALAQGQGLAADAVIQRIQGALGGDWSGAPDGLKAGDRSTVITGIATTAMATLEVLKQAAAAKANFVVTCEPTFYGRSDAQPPAAGRGRGGPGGVDATDPILVAKKEFIEKNNLVVFRLHDHWIARKENDMVAGLADSLGWSKYAAKGDNALFEIPSATAEATVAQVRTKLNLRGGLRAVGDKKATVKRVLLFTGSMTPVTMWKRYAETDMFVGGEVREWENTHYAADMFTAGEKRALVTVGRVVSEEPGMRLCAAWLKTVVKEVPATWIGAGDPYWRPA